MNMRAIVPATFVLILMAASLALANPKHGASGPPNAGFDRLKSLVGTWEGKGEDGKPIRVSYDLVSGGSALLEKLGPGEEPEMVTMYAADGPTVMMTHFCGVGNQPRMRAAGKADAKAMDFSFVDCANLAAPDAGHMHHLMLSFEDKNHFSQEWTWKEKDKESKAVFHFARKS